MSHRGGRGRGSDKAPRGGRYNDGNGRGGGGITSSNTNLSGGGGALASAPPPSIDESPIRGAGVTQHSNVALTSAAGMGGNTKGGRSGGGRGSSVHQSSSAAPPEPVGPITNTNTNSPSKFSPLSSDALGRTASTQGGKRSSMSDTPTRHYQHNHHQGHQSHENSINGGFEKPPVAPPQQQQHQPRSSFEVTAASSSSAAVRPTNSMNGSQHTNAVVANAPNGYGSNNNNSNLTNNNNTSGNSNPPPSSASGFFVASSNPSSPTSSTSPASAPPLPNLGLTNAPVDREVFVAARAAVHNAPRPVLAALLTSLLDDYPTLAPIVKFRYERAIAAVAASQQQQQQQYIGQQQIPPTSGGFWNGAGAGVGQALPSSSGSNSPCRKRSFRGRGGHEEEQQICGVHGAVRSTKHLRMSDAGVFECVPGFHCLETSKDNSNCVSPTKEGRELSQVLGSGPVLGASIHAPPFVPQHRSSFSSPTTSTPPPGSVIDQFVVQGLFQPSTNPSHSSHSQMLMTSSHQHQHQYHQSPGHLGMLRQHTQPPNNTSNLPPLQSTMLSAVGGFGVGLSGGVNAQTHSGSSISNQVHNGDDDNLEELLKSLHLASSQNL